MKGIEACRSLRVLDLSHNNLTKIEAISTIFLETLDLSFNQISRLPDHLSTLQALTTFKIKGNQLNQIGTKLKMKNTLSFFLGRMTKCL